MLTIAFLMGWKARPTPERSLLLERARKRAELRRLLASIAEQSSG